jgi:hypothetical protein
LFLGVPDFFDEVTTVSRVSVSIITFVLVVAIATVGYYRYWGSEEALMWFPSFRFVLPTSYNYRV